MYLLFFIAFDWKATLLLFSSMKKRSVTLAFTALGFCAHAQIQNVGINTTTPDASAALDVASTTQGILVPRMDSAQRAGISSPAKRLLVYQMNGVMPGFYFYNGTTWTALLSSEQQGPLEKITEGGSTGEFQACYLTPLPMPA